MPQRPGLAEWEFVPARVDDERVQPRRGDFDAPLACARIGRVVILREELGHSIFGDNRRLRDAERAFQTRVQFGALDDSRAAFETARLHDSRARGGDECARGCFESVEQCHKGEGRSSNADRLMVGDGALECAREPIDVDAFVVEKISGIALAPQNADVPHHVTERRMRLPAWVRHEVEIAQLRAVGEHEAVEARKQRRIVKPGVFDVMLPRTLARRAARLEEQFRLRDVERGERRIFERARGNGGDLAPRRRQVIPLEPKGCGIEPIRLVALDLIGEQREGVRLELRLVAAHTPA